MSRPRTQPLATRKDEDFPTRKLVPGESFEDVMRSNPQEARPVLVTTVEVTDENMFKFKNGLMMSYNGVMINTMDSDDCSQWVITEPLRKLDGSIHYADGWVRKNNGQFVAPSGLTIYPDLSMQYKNGMTVYNDGTTISPSGQRTKGQPLSVGIIYRKGVGKEPGFQFETILQPGMSPEVAATIKKVNFADRKIGYGPAGKHGEDTWGKAKVGVGSRGQSTSAGDSGKGTYVPPHRRVLPKSSSYQRKSKFDLDEIRNIVPYKYRNKIVDCGMEECGTDLFGVPMCVAHAIRVACNPYLVEALREYNSGKI